MKILLTFFISTIPIFFHAQVYTDYVGGGHIDNVSVRSSNSSSDLVALSTVDGSGLDAYKMEISRFLAQATLGADEALIEQVMELGIETWIDNQFQVPASSMRQHVLDVTEDVRRLWRSAGADLEDFFGPYFLHFNYAWWDKNMQNEDLLRQRVAFALSELLVISANSNLGDFGEELGSYYDILANGAFGNYEDLLMEVTLSPMMGFYLSHFNNEKTNPLTNTRPDQNYAREIMQLFTIGLYELNNDGTHKLDGQGNLIPTYTNYHIEELSKVFTGLSGSAVSDEYRMYGDEPFFGMDMYFTDLNEPMAMYPDYHEQGTKELVGGYVIPNGQSAMKDVRDAVSHLFNHPNVGPFVGYRLIQRLVKSNPSPAYVGRVASVFNDNGSGVRGDMKAVVKAILMDEEARSCEASQWSDNGKLREPVIRYTHIYKALPKDSPLGHYWNNGYDFYNDVGQFPMFAPSVFNFFLPDHQPVGDFAERNLNAPEFQIHNSRTSLGYWNKVYQWIIWEVLSYSFEGNFGDEYIAPVYDEFVAIADDSDALIHKLDVLFTHGQMTEEMKQTIKEAIEPFDFWDDAYFWRVKMALYLTLISPDYNIQK